MATGITSTSSRRVRVIVAVVLALVAFLFITGLLDYPFGLLPS